MIGDLVIASGVTVGAAWAGKKILSPTLDAIGDDLASCYVDLEYRSQIEDLPGQTWAPGAPVIIEIDDSNLVAGSSVTRMSDVLPTTRNEV